MVLSGEGGRLKIADNLTFFSHVNSAFQEISKNLCGHGEKAGLRIRQEKTKATAIGKDQNLPSLA